MDAATRFPASLAQLPLILSWLRGELKTIGSDETSIRKIELASEEALVNIIQHGYKNRAGHIEITLHPKKGAVEITLRDQGPPFNPLEQTSSFDPLATLEERSIGGLGILFIRQYMDDVRYKREKDSNVLILVKKIYTQRV